MSPITDTVNSPISDAQRSELIQHALAAREGAYCVYSNFHVGACLLAEDGSFVKGANVENASLGGTICAERTAIVKGVMPIYLVPAQFSSSTPFVSIAEAEKMESGDKCIVTTMGELLPVSFGPSDMGKPGP
ncbi:hypothetical protein MNV49_000361 [Pseudohyphozyma bogoriensis]|nr:hypothetical protein MNV49_000361 [Pseudohyphozyma bogoriensis]